MADLKRLLIVDDEPNNLKAIERIFWDRSDYQLEFANNGDEALARIGHFTPDIILLDIMMPGLDGYEVCKRIKSAPETANIMVLLLSGRGSLQDRLQGYEARADDYITKPYEPEELLAKISILMRLKQAQDDLRIMNRDLEEIVLKRSRELVSKERQAMVGQMVQGLVHNMKSPLTVMGGFAFMAKKQITQTRNRDDLTMADCRSALTGLEEYLNRILDGQKRLETLINNLLVTGRKNAETTATDLDINELIRNDLQFLEADMRFKHHVRKILEFADDLPLWHGVYSDFSQIFCNILNNAVDAMLHHDKNGTITISTSADNNNIQIVCRDSGPGIDPENIERIFEPFFTTKAFPGEKNDDEHVGTGLGLYTCREILKNYGGGIAAYNHDQGGACFQIRLPVKSLHLP